jgi:DNA-binding IclR family transcriptional regulator
VPTPAIASGRKRKVARQPAVQAVPASSSLTRMLAVFDAFSATHPVLSAEDLMQRMGYSRGTAYRYVRELVAAGFLTRIAGAAYTLGPRIIELDLAIRQCDPLLSAGAPIMLAMRDKLQCDVLLTSCYEDRVVVTHHERGDDRITVSFGRGRVMPLFRGAPSKAILAWLPPARQKRLYANHAAEIRAAGLGAGWEEFRTTLAALRKQGHVVSHAELDAGNVGVAVPLKADQPASARGSLALVFSSARYAIVDKGVILDTLHAAARQATQTINASEETRAP